eukprot:SAG22_NODE_12997_length_422_cov_0.907121_1_plen_89_part_10
MEIPYLKPNHLFKGCDDDTASQDKRFQVLVGICTVVPVINWPYARGLTSSIFVTVAASGEAELGCGWCTGQALGARPPPPPPGPPPPPP